MGQPQRPERQEEKGSTLYGDTGLMKGNDDILNSYCMPGPELGCLLSCSPSLGSGYGRGPHVMEEERGSERLSLLFN